MLEIKNLPVNDEFGAAANCGLRQKIFMQRIY